MKINTDNLYDLITFVQGFLDCESERMESKDVLSVGSMNDKLISIMMTLNSGTPVLLTCDDIIREQAKTERTDHILEIAENQLTDYVEWNPSNNEENAAKLEAETVLKGLMQLIRQLDTEEAE